MNNHEDILNQIKIIAAAEKKNNEKDAMLATASTIITRNENIPPRHDNLEIDDTCLSLRRLRNNNPLLVIYYPGNIGYMHDDDMETLDYEIRNQGFGYDVKKRIKNLDVIFHTFGGDADTGYMLAQMLRSFADNITFLIPYHVISAGTLTCLSADKILLGPYAFLSPIDLSVCDPSVGHFPLVSIDYYTDFAVDCRIKMENALRTTGINDAKTSVESDLLVELVREKSAMNVGRIYRERKTSACYSQILLSSYMFNDHPEAQKIAQDISNSLVFGFPAHECNMDYNMCKNLGLKAEKMSDEEYEMCRDLIRSLDESAENGVICKEREVEEECYRGPFIRLYAEHLR